MSDKERDDDIDWLPNKWQIFWIGILLIFYGELVLAKLRQIFWALNTHNGLLTQMLVKGVVVVVEEDRVVKAAAPKPTEDLAKTGARTATVDRDA